MTIIFRSSFLLLMLISKLSLFAQSPIENEINQLSEEAKLVEIKLDKHIKNKPPGTADDYQKEINTLAKTKEKLSNDTAVGQAAVSRIENDIEALEEKKNRALEWEQKKMELEKQRQAIDRDILVLSKLYDVETSQEKTRKAIRKAEATYRNNLNSNIAGFAAYVISINTLAQEKAAGYNLKESLVLLDKKTNKKFVRQIRGGLLNIGLVAGGILSYDAYDKNKNGAAAVWLLSGLAFKGLDLYFTGKDILEDKLHARQTYDAMIRNALYGDIIREDSANVMKLKADADSLFCMIEPHIGTTNDSVFIKDNWMPSMSVLYVADNVLEDMKTNIYYWERIINETDFILKNFKPTPASKRKLKSIKSSAENAVSSWLFLSEQFALRIQFLKEVHRKDLLRK